MISGFILALLLSAHVNFTPPVHDDIVLAGNFGEPRPNHFHGGIDIKTGGTEGSPVFSIGNGYVSQISVDVGGFGNAVYVRHPEGYTSIYCHLKDFIPPIKYILREYQYQKESCQGVFKFKPHDYPIAQGQLIAISGNTGSSQAPHLHLEIHDTKTWSFLDPLDFIGKHVKDNLPPMAHGFMAYPVKGQGVFSGGQNKQAFPFSSGILTREFEAWGKVGFGLWANDYMEATYNHYGVRQTELYVDGKLAFRSVIDGIPAGKNLEVNSWGDYLHYLRSHVWYLKSFVPAGVTLPFFATNHERGIIDFNQERDYKLEYVVTDFKGNSRNYSFTVTGKRRKISPNRSRIIPFWHLFRKRRNIMLLPGFRLFVKENSLGEDLQLVPKITFSTGELSDSYTLTPVSIPMFQYNKVSIRLKKKVKDPSKLYIERSYGNNRFMDGIYRDGYVEGKILDLGATYRIAYDDIPPIVSPINPASWSNSGQITIGMGDKGSGIGEYKGYIDGRFVLFGSVPKSPWVRCNLKESPVRKTNGRHRLKFVVKDRRDNVTEFNTEIIY